MTTRNHGAAVMSLAVLFLSIIIGIALGPSAHAQTQTTTGRRSTSALVDPDPSPSREATPGTTTAAAPAAAAAATCSASSPEISLAGALFTAHRVAEGLAWDARYIVNVDAAFDFRGGIILFAVPLPQGESLEHATAPSEENSITPLTQSGPETSRAGGSPMTTTRIFGLCVSPAALHERTIAASFIQRTKTDREDVLGVPIASGGVVQIIESGRSDEPRLEVAVGAGGLFERHVGYVAPRAISHAAREEARRLTDMQLHLTSSPIYVRGDDLRAAGGINGRIVDPHALARSSALGIGVVFAGIVVALVLGARRLHHAANVERADALLASEIDDAAGKALRSRARARVSQSQNQNPDGAG